MSVYSTDLSASVVSMMESAAQVRHVFTMTVRYSGISPASARHLRKTEGWQLAERETRAGSVGGTGGRMCSQLVVGEAPVK